MVRVAVYPVYPYISPCLVNSSCKDHLFGYNVLLFEYLMNLAGITDLTYHRSERNSDAIDQMNCTNHQLFADLMCGRADATANMFYFTLRPAILKYLDVTHVVEPSRSTVLVPKILRKFTGSDIVRILASFDIYSWIGIAAVMFLSRIKYINRLTRVRVLLAVSNLFLNRLSRTTIVSHTITGQMTVPAFSSFDTVIEAIDDGRALLAFSKPRPKYYFLHSSDSHFQGLGRALYKDEKQRITTTHSGNQSAWATLQSSLSFRRGQKLIVSLVNENHYKRLDCSEQNQIHKIVYDENALLAFAFPKHSNLTRPFNGAMKHLLGGTDTFLEHAKKRYGFSTNCAPMLQLEKPRPIELHDLRSIWGTLLLLYGVAILYLIIETIVTNLSFHSVFKFIQATISI